MFLIIRVNDQAFCISSQTCKVSSFSYQKVFKKLLLREFSDRSIYFFFLHLAARVESFLLYNLDELSWFKMLYFEHKIWFNKKETNEAPPYIYNTIYIHTSRMFLIQCHGDLFPIFQLALDWQYQTVHQSSAKDTTTMQSSKVLFSIVFFHPHALEW